MNTECTGQTFLFQPQFTTGKPNGRKRSVEATFDGGVITSDGGALLVREVEEKRGILRQFAECFADYRRPDLTEREVYELLAQRVYGIVPGYEDLKDHDDLRHDPLPALLVGKTDVTGEGRKHKRDRGKALAGKSTLNRLELTPEDADAGCFYPLESLPRLIFPPLATDLSYPHRLSGPFRSPFPRPGDKCGLERLPKSLSKCARRSVGGIGDPASSSRDRRSTEITDLGYNCGVFLRFLFRNRSRSGFITMFS